ncbi:hypothetical protein [Streptomyces lunalinharesii]|uniref:Uncharacterized protein n=1 Tax=Streptomyces lunalinharesii TaxID=333384 RepID=A0ABN3RHS1_9ACTN
MAPGYVPPVGSRLALDVDSREPELTLPAGARFTEPVLLGLAALAVRGRVERG